MKKESTEERNKRKQENILKAKKLKEKGKKKAKNVISDFKSFALKGNIFDLAIGLIIGNAFTKIVNSLVSEVILPAFSTITGKIDYSRLFFAVDGKQYQSIEAAKTAGIATINYGNFISGVVDFFVMAIVIFIFMRYMFNKRKDVKKVETITTKKCPYCLSEVPIQATKCAYCTSDLKEEIKEDKTTNENNDNIVN